MIIETKLLLAFVLALSFTLLSDCSYAPVPAASEAGILTNAR